jgi:hypothetical protein
VFAAVAGSWPNRDRADPAASLGSSREAYAWITVRPAQGQPADTFQIKGGGFPPRQRIEVSMLIDNQWVDIGPVTTNEFGELLASIDPRTTLAAKRIPAGTHRIMTNVGGNPRFHVGTDYTVRNAP